MFTVLLVPAALSVLLQQRIVVGCGCNAVTL
jgi:hypothetical protein